MRLYGLVCSYGGTSLGRNATNCDAVVDDTTTSAHFLAESRVYDSKCGVVVGTQRHRHAACEKQPVFAAFGDKKKKRKRKRADSYDDSVRVSCGNYSDAEINIDFSISDDLRFDGGPLGVRTLDLGIKSPLLYQLS